MQLIECSRLRLKAMRLPCGETEQCFFPRCPNLPDGAEKPRPTQREFKRFFHTEKYNALFSKARTYHRAVYEHKQDVWDEKDI